MQLKEGKDYVRITHPTYKYKLIRQITIDIDLRGYIVSRPYYNLSMSGILRVQKGYCWDGPSGPTVDTASSMRASLAHDVLYQMLREGDLMIDREYIPRKHNMLRWEADAIMYRICRQDDMPIWRALFWYLGLRLGGRKHALPEYF